MTPSCVTIQLKAIEQYFQGAALLLLEFFNFGKIEFLTWEILGFSWEKEQCDYCSSFLTTMI